MTTCSQSASLPLAKKAREQSVSIAMPSAASSANTALSCRFFMPQPVNRLPT